MHLDGWQKEILNSKGNIILCTGRRVGKTTIFAIKAAELMAKNPKTQIIAVSLTEDQAFLMRAMVEDYLTENYKAYLKVPKKKKPTKNQINLNNGSTYIVRPVGQTGNALRGFNANILIIDEAAFMPEMMWAAATPTLLTTAGNIWMCSTPNVKEGWFYEQFEAAKTKKSQRFKVWHISSEEVIHNRPVSETWTKKQRLGSIQYLLDEKATKSTIRYAQEYLGEFMDDLMRVFPDEWIDRICTEKPENLMRNQEYALGVDIARFGGDETTFEIIRKVNNEYNPPTYKHVYDEHKTQTATTWTESRIIELDNVYYFEKIYIDAGAGSLGVGVLDHLLRIDQTKFKVEAINNKKIVVDKREQTKQRLIKEDLYDNLYAMGERNEIKLLNSDAVRASLRSITREVITNEKTGISKIYIKGTYDHIVEGIIRAAWYAKEKHLNLLISSFSI